MPKNLKHRYGVDRKIRSLEEAGLDVGEGPNSSAGGGRLFAVAAGPTSKQLTSLSLVRLFLITSLSS
jgi:hypothetical protein